MLALRGVRKSFDGHTALESTDLSFESGKTTVLIGPSGCGKSTLLRLILGLIPPDGGSVVFEDESVTPVTAPRLRVRMGYVIQSGGLFPHLTARENVTLVARLRGWASDRIEARLESLRELTDFPPTGLDRYPLQLSGGQRQRVSLMRALMLEPELLLLDEPLGALDPMIRVELQEQLREIFRALGKTVVLVTHDLAEAGFFGDRIVLLDEGRIVQEGTIEELLAAPRDSFTARFVRAQRFLSSDGSAS